MLLLITAVLVNLKKTADPYFHLKNRCTIVKFYNIYNIVQSKKQL